MLDDCNSSVPGITSFLFRYSFEPSTNWKMPKRNSSAKASRWNQTKSLISISKLLKKTGHEPRNHRNLPNDLILDITDGEFFRSKFHDIC